MEAIKAWCDEHKGVWQFIKFNVLSNISTVSRFVCAWLGAALFVDALGLTSPFKFFVFDYSQASSGGLGGFLSFLVAEVVAQVVNFFVQKEWVFESKTGFETAAPKFALMAAVIVVVNLVLPGRVVALCQGLGLSSGLSSTTASAVNTLLAVVVSYPLLKYWIMPEE